MAKLKILKKVAFIALVVGALMAFVLLVLPDGNDYAMVTIDKHRRLNVTPGPKIVFIGGSNLAYGLDSERIEKKAEYHVVNMGMNAYFGLRFMLDEVVPSLYPRDVIVLSLENEMFLDQEEFDPVDGRAMDFLMIAKVRPASLEFIPWGMRAQLLGVIPEVVHKKTIRIIGEIAHRASHTGHKDLLDAIETRAGFNEYGDLISHIGVSKPPEMEPWEDLSKAALDPRVPGLLREYHDSLRKRQVRMLVLPPPMPERYYRTYAQKVEAIMREIDEAVPGARIASPQRYVFPEPCFFDDVHHLTGECRIKRTELAIEDLKRTLPSPRMVSGN